MISVCFPLVTTEVFITDTEEAKFTPSSSPWLSYEQLTRTGKVNYNSAPFFERFPYEVSGVGWKYILICNLITEHII
jgi:hypothetical protein